jgi:hypothetical protein
VEEASVGMVVLLFTAPDEVSLSRGTASRLAAVGVTHATVLRDGSTVAVVLEGWGFDADRSGPEAAEVVAGSSSGCQVLRQMVDTSVVPEAWRGPGDGVTDSRAVARGEERS